MARLMYTGESKEGRKYYASVDGVNAGVDCSHQTKVHSEGNEGDKEDDDDCDEGDGNHNNNNNNFGNLEKILRKNASNGRRSTPIRKMSNGHSFESSTVAKLASKFGAVVVQKNRRASENACTKTDGSILNQNTSTVEKNIRFFERDTNCLETKKTIRSLKTNRPSPGIVTHKSTARLKDKSDKNEMPEMHPKSMKKIEDKSNKYEISEVRSKSTKKTGSNSSTRAVTATMTTKPVELKPTSFLHNKKSRFEKTLDRKVDTGINETCKETNPEVPDVIKKNTEKDVPLYGGCYFRLLKNAPLSVAEDCGLESALNGETVDKTTATLSKNSSFLHHGLDKISALKNCAAKVESNSEEKASNYHQCQWPAACDNLDQNTYADIEDVRNENTTSNVYDYVVYSEKMDDQIQNYEVVSSSSDEYYDNVSEGMPTFSSFESDNSDSSLELANSLYDETIKTDSVFSNNGDNRAHSLPIDNIDSIYVYINDGRSTNSAISDDWMDINSCDSDESGQKKTIVTKKRIHFGKSYKFKKKKSQHSRRKKFSVCSPSTIYFCGNSGNSWNQLDKSEELHHDSTTILRSILYSLPNYEAQEVTTLLLDYPEDNSSGTSTEIKNQNHIPQFCDDFDDSSFEEDEPSLESSTELKESRLADKDWLPNIQSSQNIYGLVKKARKTVRKSWSSLNQIRKNSIGNISMNFQPHKNDTATEIASNQNRPSSNQDEKVNVKNRSINNGKGGSMRWTSFKTKLRPKYSTVTSNSSSVFYVNPEDLRFGKSLSTRSTEVACDKEIAANRRRRTSGIDFNLTRPSSPPPPPPVNKSKPREKSGSTVVLPSHSSNDSEHSFTLSDNRSSISEFNSSVSEYNLSSCSDLQLRFADEPLYQFYAESVAQLSNSASLDYLNESDGYEEIGSVTSRPSALELITPSPNGHGQCRSLWCEVPEVNNSDILDTLSISRQKLQEAKFEVLTSEASYYKSLSVLDKLFISNNQLKQETLVCKNDWKVLFGNVSAVRKCSQKFLSALEKCWQESIMLTGLCDIINEYACNNFEVYVKYCSNQVYIDRTLKKLRENPGFVQLISQLESDPMCQSLSLHSFLMLPMQRITRMPLLVDAILSKLDPQDDKTDYENFQLTLSALNRVVRDCNENARKFERYEEMLLLSRQLEFSRKEMKMFSIASSSRWLVRSGSMLHVTAQDAKSTITRKLTKQTNKFYFFLFNDILIIAKKKSEDNYVVFDYCLRNVMQMDPIEETVSLLPSNNVCVANRYLLVLTILENHEGKKVEMILSCDSDSTRQRWLKATSSQLSSDNPDEKLYEEWDCPMELAVHAYSATQPDEMSLQAGDVIKVLKKTTDGWYHGERIRDGNTGWFPGNYTVEIASQHKRAKNLKLRHRLLTLSANYLQNQQQK